LETVLEQRLKIEIIDGKTVRECLSMERCIALMVETQIALYQQKALAPQRLKIGLFEGDDELLVMPAVLQEPAVAGIKTLTLCPDNPKASEPSLARPAIQGLMTLFDSSTGSPIALVDAASITAIRTAAASGAATQVLAKEDASILCLLGTGVQAETHLKAMLAVRPITQVRVWGRSGNKAESFAQRMQSAMMIPIEAKDNISNAVKGADIICALTGSQEPIVQGEWIKSGAHLNLVGSHSPNAREVDTCTIQHARLFVEVKSAALKEAGDILIPLQAKEIRESHILGEIALVHLDEVPGRVCDEDITVYKSLGNAAQDLAAAYAVYLEACKKGKTQKLLFES
jgi:ornithine cyclodeaminase